MLKYLKSIHLLDDEAANGLRSATVGRFQDCIICGDAEAVLRCLPEESVNCVVTSPPYFLQRNYEHDQQIGTEESSDQYLQRLLAVFKECFRVLKQDGTLWLNLGDKYLNNRLLGMPWRTALALEQFGWILRSDVIWHKPNAMPASITSRPTTDHEYVFLFSKSKRYRYFADAIREPHVTFSDKSKMKGGRGHFGKAGGTPETGKNKGQANLHRARWDQAFHPRGRNKRTVWSIPLSKFPDAHFAVFPEKLVETCILAATEPNDIVLDPFLGSGTTALMACRLGRHFVGVDCSEKFCRMSYDRINAEYPSLFFAKQTPETLEADS